MSVGIVLGTRPELVKMAPVLSALERGGTEVVLIHTGQHYDQRLSGEFFKELNIREPDHHLNVGSGTQAPQTAECMLRLEKVLGESRPSIFWNRK